MSWIEPLTHIWPHLAAGFGLLTALLASGHALLHKRDPRAATLWIVVIWLLPILGAVAYLVLGVNRIRRRAIQLNVHVLPARAIPENLGEPRSAGAEHLRHLARAVHQVTGRPLVGGNGLEPLVNGDAAFPAMIAAIDGAEASVSLASYIFDRDPTGIQFVDALARAHRRGVDIRVLVDAAGARYSFPSIFRELRRAQIPCAAFLPSSLLQPWRIATLNLRNHRKLVVVDGRTAFTGGINLRAGHVLAGHPAHPVQDLHFRVAGPVVTQLQEAFVNDWAFSTGEVLDGSAWFADPVEGGDVTARVITDGPDGDFEKLRLTLIAALGEAESSVRIVTPYFLPDPTVIAALNLAALRGVQVDIILPAVSNLPFVRWASRALWWQVLERGCRIWLTPPPFDHSKLMIVDSHWVLLGSANWDPRSLRLNFELNVECYGREFAGRMEAIVAEKLRSACEINLADADGRPVWEKLRDATARLFSPYL